MAVRPCVCSELVKMRPEGKPMDVAVRTPGPGERTVQWILVGFMHKVINKYKVINVSHKGQK